MKLHILSDLHLSVSELALTPTVADVLVLAGDIGRPEQAVAFAVAAGKPVLYVAGNHEFYGRSIDRTIAGLRQLCAGSAVHFLEGDECVLGGTRFLGTTLWTDFALFPEPALREQAVQMATRLMRDFARIRRDEDSESLFTPADAAARHALSLAWLERKLDQSWAGPTVVITHHAPSTRSIHRRFAGSPINAGFVSGLERLMGARRVALWIHGHTHNSFDYEIEGTRVVCNPRGYARLGVNENPEFDPAFIVELPGTA